MELDEKIRLGQATNLAHDEWLYNKEKEINHESFKEKVIKKYELLLQLQDDFNERLQKEQIRLEEEAIKQEQEDIDKEFDDDIDIYED